MPTVSPAPVSDERRALSLRGSRAGSADLSLDTATLRDQFSANRTQGEFDVNIEPDSQAAWIGPPVGRLSEQPEGNMFAPPSRDRGGRAGSYFGESPVSFSHPGLQPAILLLKS